MSSMPVFKNDVVNAQKESESLNAMIPVTLTRVLVIYTGGTLGMHNHSKHGYVPCKGYLSGVLSKDPRFNDPSFKLSSNTSKVHRVCPQAVATTSINGTYVNNVDIDVMVTPASLYGKRIRYSILEYDPLLDSSNMTMSDWVKIATDIEINYTLFDAFLVLHGTDTMAYSASALSFMLENLGKTVIITGSQVPISEIRNDAVGNLLNSLTICGHFVIPEVGLFFDNKLLRGNRSSKMNALEFNAFDSPNLRPLVSVGINIGKDA